MTKPTTSIKNLAGVYPKLVIRDVLGDKIAIGRPMESTDLSNTSLVRKLTTARSHYKHMFLTQFSASDQRTLAWMRKTITLTDRILFLLERNTRCVGHYGIILCDESSVELDNSILWDPEVPKNFMAHVEHAILGFIFGFLGKQRAFARVLDRNIICTAMHQTAGLRFERYEPLVEELLENGDRVLHVAEKNSSERPVARLMHWHVEAKDYWQTRKVAGYKPIF